jgi:excisionase family DNA binding protein
MSDPAKNKSNGIQAELLISIVDPLLDLLADKIAERLKPAPKEDRLLTVEEVCTALGVPKTWIYHHVRKLPFVRKVGGNLRFSAIGLQRYIEAAKFTVKGDRS